MSAHKHPDGRAALRHPLAIKVTKPNEYDLRSGDICSYDDVESRCQEVRALIRLREAHLVAGTTSSHVLYLHEFFWMYDIMTRTGQLYFVTDALGQELDQWRRSQTVLMESSVKTIARVLLNALDFMARARVVHRDVKLQNILFRENGDLNTLTVVDFGLAKVLDDNETANEFCGTLGYMAPEIYQELSYRFEVDMFAFGVVLFRLLSGTKPFQTANSEKLRTDTINLKYMVDEGTWEGVSTDARQLVRNLLIGPKQRFTARQALRHRWFSQSVEDSVISLSNSQRPSDAPGETMRSNAIAMVSLRCNRMISRMVLSGLTVTFLCRSKARAPPGPQSVRDGIQFWLDDSVELALNILMVERKYEGRVVNVDSTGFICVEESKRSGTQGSSRSGTRFLLADHVASLSRYTEKDCRRICLEIAHIIKLSHDNGMAHRNLHLNNFIVDKMVSFHNFVRSRIGPHCICSLVLLPSQHFKGKPAGAGPPVCRGHHRRPTYDRTLWLSLQLVCLQSTRDRQQLYSRQISGPLELWNYNLCAVNWRFTFPWGRSCLGRK
jgi:serine/threonine protein kinase